MIGESNRLCQRSSNGVLIVMKWSAGLAPLDHCERESGMTKLLNLRHLLNAIDFKRLCLIGVGMTRIFRFVHGFGVLHR
jgi:hypothetical protein